MVISLTLFAVREHVIPGRIRVRVRVRVKVEVSIRLGETTPHHINICNYLSSSVNPFDGQNKTRQDRTRKCNTAQGKTRQENTRQDKKTQRQGKAE